MTNLSGINLNNGSAVGAKREGMESPSHSLALMPKYDDYKRTPVDWIESIPSHWNFWRFKYLLKEINIRSTTGSEELLSLSKYKGVIPKDSLAERAGAAESLVGYKKVFINDLVINKMQAVNGLLAVSKMEGITSPDYSVYRPKDPDLIDYRYLGYLLSMPEYLGEFKRRVTGVMEGFIRLYTDDLFAICSILPPHDEQTRIANFLDKKTAQIDDAIAIKEQQISLLKERKQIIIQQAVTQGLDPNVPMKDSGVDWIGKIPEHWEVRRAKYIFKKENRPVRLEDDVVTCFRDGQVTLRTNRRTEGFTFATKEHGYQGIRKGDLVIHAMDAFAGAIGVSDSDGKSSPVYSACTPVKGVKVNPKYYALYLRNLALGGFIESLAKGIRERSTDFRYKDFSELFFPLPDIETQNKVVLEIEKSHQEIDGGISVLTKQIEKIKEYKTSLINSAVTGKIKITPEMIEQ